MNSSHIYNLDLNLLLALHALAEEKSVSRAAARFSITQSAMSRHLAKLRDLMEDPLLVRTRHGMKPTARLKALEEPLSRLIADASCIVARRPSFDPATAERRFVVSMADYVGSLVLPKLTVVLQESAPGIDIMIHRPRLGWQDRLEDGQLDLAIEPLGQQNSSGLMVQGFYQESLLCLLRKGHPRIKKRMSLESYCQLKHVLVAPFERPGSFVDQELARRGKQRRVCLTVPGFLGVGQLISRTDLVAILPASLARQFAENYQLNTFTVPVKLEGFRLGQYWHQSREQDPALAWLRGGLKDILSTQAK